MAISVAIASSNVGFFGCLGGDLGSQSVIFRISVMSILKLQYLRYKSSYFPFLI